MEGIIEVILFHLFVLGSGERFGEPPKFSARFLDSLSGFLVKENILTYL